ncbi:putative ribonuclease H-like domain-containing protein [Tanacetum coccineum]
MLIGRDHESEDMEKGAFEVYGMIAGYGDDAVIPAVDVADEVSTNGIFADGVFVAAGNGCDDVFVAAGVGADGVSVTSSDATGSETQFALMGLSPQINQLALEEKIRILTADLGNTTNMLKYTEKLNEQAKIDNMNNKVKLKESEASDQSFNSRPLTLQTCVSSTHPHTTKDLVFVDSGYSRSITGNKEKLIDLKLKIKGGLSLLEVYDKECLVLSKEFHLPDSSQVVLRVPRRHNLYCFNLTNIHSEREIKCLLAKAYLDESTKWHRRMAHVNFKNMNKLAKHGLVNGLPSKLFTNEHNCVACNKGKQHKASYKAITVVSTIS